MVKHFVKGIGLDINYNTSRSVLCFSFIFFCEFINTISHYYLEPTLDCMYPCWLLASLLSYYNRQHSFSWTTGTARLLWQPQAKKFNKAVVLGLPQGHNWGHCPPQPQLLQMIHTKHTQDKWTDAVLTRVHTVATPSLQCGLWIFGY